MPTCWSPRHVRRTGVFIAPSGYYREDGESVCEQCPALILGFGVVYRAFFFIKLVSAETT